MTDAGPSPRLRTAAIVLLVAVFYSLTIGSHAGAFTSDDYFSRECKGTAGCDFQWGLDRVGAEYAWPVDEGAGILIGVIDSGVDLNHPDLKDQIVQGADFVGGGASPTDNDPQDEYWHGTAVAGIAAAVTGNGIGVASVAPKAKVLPVRVFGPDGSGTSDDVIQGINYAVDRARALNMSLILNLSFEASEEEGKQDPLAQLLNTPEVDQAIKGAADAGAAVVIAAGNEGLGRTSYDAPDARGIAVVGASDQNDSRLSLSNYGAGLDLLAPGIRITTTFWDADRGSVYGVAGGTSMAVPFVVGAAAMLMSKGMTNVQAISHILTTARDLGEPGRDNETGHGLLDVASAMGVERPGNKAPTKAPSTKPSPPPSPSPSPFVLPSPGSPPPLVQPASTNSPSLATGTVTASSPPQEPVPPLRPIAASLIGLVTVMHGVRRLLLT